MSKTDMDDEDDLIRAMREELEKVLTNELGDSVYTGESKVDADLQFERIQKSVIGVLVDSVRTQRLCFVVRSVVMGLIGALIYFIVVWYLGTIDVVQAVFLGIFVFATSLVVSRLLDKQIVKGSKKIIIFLNKHRRLRTFVLKRL
jgi:hypothetical protein